MNYQLIAEHLPTLLDAAGVTLGTWLLGACLALVLGFAVALLRRYGPRALNWLLGLCVELIRGTPFLIQLFLLYYGGPYIGLVLDPVTAGVMGLGIYGAAYFSEVFRAGFEAIPRGHAEVAECLGMTRGQVIRRVLLPEMMVLVLPPLTNMLVVLLKETAVLSIITVPELTFHISSIGSEQYAFVEALFLLACFYWALVEWCGWLGRKLERRLERFRFAAS